MISLQPSQNNSRIIYSDNKNIKIEMMILGNSQLFHYPMQLSKLC